MASLTAVMTNEVVRLRRKNVLPREVTEETDAQGLQPEPEHEQPSTPPKLGEDAGHPGSEHRGGIGEQLLHAECGVVSRSMIDSSYYAGAIAAVAIVVLACQLRQT